MATWQDIHTTTTAPTFDTEWVPIPASFFVGGVLIFSFNADRHHPCYVERLA
ncbi:hypothetical protein BOTBODRAFT_30822 [Botryobasidium botryosum FD-172 SS1]|uniref:Uncharacterized protein n=1 Tax=Botryobasidium botryosum (strain FD-172 SS1) TaxID=930990 RepID=A0A067MLS0_BOTB1|nr:hypothetical protein BOTBODRAFT_30822 [Botryobasidium botryosum FD-172 SS1]